MSIWNCFKIFPVNSNPVVENLWAHHESQVWEICSGCSWKVVTKGDFKILKIRSLAERWCSNELWNWQLHLLIRLWLCSWKLRVGSWHLILHSENYEIFCWDCWQILFKMQRIYQGYACHFMELTVFPLLAFYRCIVWCIDLKKIGRASCRERV